MVDQDLIERVIRLPASARLELIELLSHSLREELATPAYQQIGASTMGATKADKETPSVLTAVDRLARSYGLDVTPDSSLHQILGIVPSGAVPMTKDEVR